jgi:NAD(P)-dependent dehydrogenase (short-subunit alcohol dehydrogenase family)
MVDGDLAGRTVVVTGASSGIGAAAARRLHELGAEVHVVGRSPERTAEIAREVGTAPIGADFARLADVRAAADEVLARCSRIDVLVNNAGLSLSRREVTDDGHERMFQVNHLAPFLFTSLLLDRIAESAPSRVITTASAANLTGFVNVRDLDSRRVFLGPVVYGTTKLENILFTRELARRVEGSGVLATCFHPGVVATNFGRGDLIGVLWKSPLRLLMRSPEQGADTLVWLATAPPEQLRAGGYYVDRRLGALNPQALSGSLARRLWERSEQLVGLDERSR